MTDTGVNKDLNDIAKKMIETFGDVRKVARQRDEAKEEIERLHRAARERAKAAKVVDRTLSNIYAALKRAGEPDGEFVWDQIDTLTQRIQRLTALVDDKNATIAQWDGMLTDIENALAGLGKEYEHIPLAHNTVEALVGDYLDLKKKAKEDGIVFAESMAQLVDRKSAACKKTEQLLTGLTNLRRVVRDLFEWMHQGWDPSGVYPATEFGGDIAAMVKSIKSELKSGEHWVPTHSLHAKDAIIKAQATKLKKMEDDLERARGQREVMSDNYDLLAGENSRLATKLGRSEQLRKTYGNLYDQVYALSEFICQEIEDVAWEGSATEGAKAIISDYKKRLEAQANTIELYRKRGQQLNADLDKSREIAGRKHDELEEATKRIHELENRLNYQFEQNALLTKKVGSLAKTASEEVKKRDHWHNQAQQEIVKLNRFRGEDDKIIVRQRDQIKQTKRDLEAAEKVNTKCHDIIKQQREVIEALKREMTDRKLKSALRRQEGLVRKIVGRQ